MRKANETKAMSLLKQYYSAQMIRAMEGGTFGTLESFGPETGGSGMLDPELMGTTNLSAERKPVPGSLFSELTTGSNGAPRDRRIRSGPAAYPADPGKSGGKEWNYYVASWENVTGPVTSWPTASEFGSTWVKLRKRTPA